MGYVGLTVVVALALPLGATLERRARTSLENRNLLRATALAQRLSEWNLTPAGLPVTQSLLDEAAGRFEGRVLFVDADGLLVADSNGATAGSDYATAGRPEVRRALAGRAWSDVRYSRDLGMDLMATAVPVVEEVEGTGQIVILGAIRITQTLEEADETVRRTTIGLVGLGATALAAALGLAWLLAGSLARPLRSLAETTRRFGAGDLGARAGSPASTAEVAEVAASFDAMAERVERLVRSQREFVGDASHQMRTPLTGVKLQLEEALAATDVDAAKEPLRAAEREVDRLTEILGRLLTKAAGADTPRRTTADLRAVADRAEVRRRERARRAGRTLTCSGPSVAVAAEAADLDEACDTLVDNALRHGAGPIEIRVEAGDGLAHLSVLDRGRGIHPDDVERVTERYERGRDAAGEGTGLGLAITRELAERWGGSLTIDSTGDATTATVTFPRATVSR